MADLKLAEALRYGVSGAIAILLWLASHPDLFKNPALASTGAAAGLTILAVVFGVVIYSLHRALIYWGLYWLLLSCMPCDKRSKWASTNELDEARWKTNEFHFSEWADQIHFLYCSCWATLFSLILRSCAPPPSASTLKNGHILWIAAIFFAAALTHHIRFLNFLLEYLNKNAPEAATNIAEKKPSLESHNGP
jgi:hypothetical protein